LKNSDLFKDLPALEASFFHPEEYPWQTLMRVLNLLKQHAEKHSWPEEDFPACNFKDTNSKMELSTGGVIESEVNIRGSGAEFSIDYEAYMKGPIYLGKGVKLRKSAVVTGPCWLGDGVTIGHGCRIKNSIILQGAHIVYGTRLDYAIIGKNVQIQANVACTEKPFFGETVICGPEGARVRTHLPDLGLIAGDGSYVGAGTVCSAGTILMPDTKVEEGSRLLQGFLRSGKVPVPRDPFDS
jgi:NDP-sugar pyrophosphorylase family protein